MRVAKLAWEYRQTFHKDVVIDMVCYRRYGHNEGDDPSYTQPLMYKAIAERRSVRKLYVETLVKRGDITVEEAEQALVDFQRQAAGRPRRDARRARRRTRRRPSPPKPLGVLPHIETGVERGHARPRSSASSPTTPRASRPSEAGQAVRGPRQQLYADGEVDWATAEALAFGSLVLEGHPVRLAGEDSRRGTFSQRHAALVDYETGEPWIPLDDLEGAAGQLLGVRLAAVRVRGDGLRVRLRPVQPRRARDVGGAVRRLRQRRADHHRPVHRRRRGQVGPAATGSCCCCRTATRARVPSTARRASSASSRSPPRTTCRSSTPPPRRSTSTCCAARCTAMRQTPLVVFTPKQGLRMKQTRSHVDELTHRLVPGGARRSGRHRRRRVHAHRVLLRQGRLGRDRRARRAAALRPRSCASSSSTRCRPSRC